jgi:hypothetical protein
MAEMTWQDTRLCNLVNHRRHQRYKEEAYDMLMVHMVTELHTIMKMRKELNPDV